LKNRFWLVFIFTSITYNLTLLEFQSTDVSNGETSLMYGHILPIAKEGATSLSYTIDCWNILIEFVVLYLASSILLKLLKINVCTFKNWLLLGFYALFFVLNALVLLKFSIQPQFDTIQMHKSYEISKSFWGEKIE